jgi:4-amino-4-deoxy-L-arabinose transferase-like glycosyltransferase
MSNAPTRWHRPALFLILALGAVLRFTALGQGIPFALGIDEPEIMERAVRMMNTGDLHPHFFDYPGLYIYIQFLVACVRFVVGSIGGLWANLNQAPPAEFYLWGRAVTAAFGTATIALVYLLGRRISPTTGLLAAALFAVQSLHVRESHFVLTDVPMTFFIALTAVLTLRACERRRFRDCVFVGLAVGAAAATKYNGGVAILLPALALLLSPGTWVWRLRAMLLTSGVAALTFLMCAPYTVIALPEFLNAFAYLAHMYAEGPPRPEPAWMTYLKHLRNNFSIPGLILAAGGLAVAVRALLAKDRTPVATAWALAASFTLVYFYMIAGQRLVWGRYLLPLLPFLCVLAAGGIVWVAGQVARRWSSPRAVAVTAALLLLLVAYQPANNVRGFLSTASKVSTNQQAYEWILANVPAGSRIANETREVLLPVNRYTIDYPRRLITHDVDHYQREGVRYLIASSLSFKAAFYDVPPEPAALAGYTELFRRTEHLITFMPSADHPGPELRIYRVPANE